MKLKIAGLLTSCLFTINAIAQSGETYIDSPCAIDSATPMSLGAACMGGNAGISVYFNNNTGNKIKIDSIRFEVPNSEIGFHRDTNYNLLCLPVARRANENGVFTECKPGVELAHNTRCFINVALYPSSLASNLDRNVSNNLMIGYTKNGSPTSSITTKAITGFVPASTPYDLTFGTSGVVDLPRDVNVGYTMDIKARNDNGLLLANMTFRDIAHEDYSETESNLVMLGLNNSGRLDTNFASGGVSITNSQYTDVVEDIKMDASGSFAVPLMGNKLLNFTSTGAVSGSKDIPGLKDVLYFSNSFINYHTVFADPNKYPPYIAVNNWNTGQITTTNLDSGNYNATPRYHVSKTTGKITLVQGFDPALNAHVMIRRYNQDMTPDTSFGNGSGFLKLKMDSRSGSVLVFDDGRIMRLKHKNADNIYYTPVIELYDANGNQAAVRNTPFAGSSFDSFKRPLGTNSTSQLQLAADGKIYYSVNYNECYAVTRLNQNGIVDTGFAKNGLALASFSTKFADILGHDMTVDSQSKVVLVNKGGDNLRIVRFSNRPAYRPPATTR